MNRVERKRREQEEKTAKASSILLYLNIVYTVLRILKLLTCSHT
ncbi:hypothetical protein JPSP52_18800 [Staphylococcus pseudintermedius]